MEWIQGPIRRQLPANYREDYALLVHESSKLITIIYSQALEYRDENAARYELGSGPVSNPWLASTQCLSILQSQCELIETVLSKFPDITQQQSQSMTMDTDDTSDLSGFPDKLQSALRQHLCDMADHLLGAYRDRIYYLKSLQSPEALLELQSLEQTSKMLQSKLIMPLVQYGRKTSAYFLAEKYRDFQILVDLTLQDVHKESRIDDYIHRFQEEFTQVLFTTYYQREMYLELMQQKVEYQDYIDRFLEQAQLPWLAWIQDVNAGRFDQAFNNLLLVVNAEQIIEKKKVCVVVHDRIMCSNVLILQLSISLAKLAFLTYFEDDNEESPEKEKYIGCKFLCVSIKLNSQMLDLEKLLELVEVQEAIRLEFLKPFGSTTPGDVVGRVLSSRFKKTKRDYPIFSLVITNSLKKLLQGQVLSSNELIDLLTLVDDPASLDAFVGSMEILYRSVPAVQEPFLIRNRIWRRAFLSAEYAFFSKR
jgi:nuclear pore complex protein Nup133